MSSKTTIEEKWHQQSEVARAEKLPYGKERDLLVRKARQLQTASQNQQWLSSPELKPPGQGRSVSSVFQRQRWVASLVCCTPLNVEISPPREREAPPEPAQYVWSSEDGDCGRYDWR
jgi:hypothetical protein